MTTCPTCSGHGKINHANFERREHSSMRNIFDNQIAQYMRENNIFKRRSCLICVEKHVGEAREYYKEMLKFQNSGKDDLEARISWEENHIAIIGSLGLAIEESQTTPDLQLKLIASRRTYQYEHVEPNWREIIIEILKVKEQEK